VDDGWQNSANAWIAEQGVGGDFGRRYVLDPVMLARATSRSNLKVLDVGCGEGRFCRMLRPHSRAIVGIDPTPGLIAAARVRDKSGAYLRGIAEHLPFPDASFDLVVSYLTLIDIPDVHAGIREMARVLQPGGRLLIANLNGFNTALADQGWVKDHAGRNLYYPIDHYLEERAMWIEYRGIRVVNHHRPMSTYLQALIGAGLTLTYFDEPVPSMEAPSKKAEHYCRVPWFLVMEWMKPAS
jgi:SAM-dependent methyltransferase